MKRGTIKRLVAMLCIGVLFFSNVSNVFAESVTNSPAIENGQDGIELPEDSFPEIPEDETTNPEPEQPEITDPEPEQPEHVHVYVETVTKEPTNLEKGEKTFTCECGNTYTEEIPALMLMHPSTKLINTPNGVEVSWESVEGAATYKVYKGSIAMDKESYMEFANVDSTVTSLLDTDVQSGVAYYYNVMAYNDEKQSNEQSSVGIVFLNQPVLTGEMTESTAELSWEVVQGAKSYLVEKKTEDTQWSVVAEVESLNYSDTDVVALKEYTYRIKASFKNDEVGGESVYSKELVLLNDTVEVPGGFAVANNGYTQLKITWNKVSDAEGYKIYRSESEDDEFELVATVNADTEKYVDKNLTTDKKYYYKMTAFSGKCESEFTAVKSSTPKVIVPKMKKTANATGTSIKVSWSKPTGAHGYYVYRKQGTNGTWKQIATIKDPDVTSYTDKTATGRYYYAARAYKKVNGKTYTSLRANSVQASVLKKASITVSQKGTEQAVTVKWGKIANATGYQVYKKIGSNGSWVLAKTTGASARSYSCEIPQGKNTYWKVRAIRKIGETTTYALFSAEKNFSFATPNFVFEVSSNYGSSVKNIKLTIKNTAKQDVRFYSKNTAVIHETNDSYDRALYIVGSNGNKLNYSTINAGKTKTITYKVDGKATRYQSDSILCLTFRYDGLEYVLLTYANGSYFELYLAEDFWAQ